MKNLLYVLVVLIIIAGVYFMFFGENNVSYETENGTNTQVQDDDIQEEMSDITDATSSEGETVSDKKECDDDNEYGMCETVLGHSVQDQPISAFTVGDAETTILVMGGVHTGVARNSYDLTTQLLEHYAQNQDVVPQNVQLVFVPLVNPDGIANNTRTNANGVDLNRNWPTNNWTSAPYHPQLGTQEGAGGTNPLSEPETQALHDYIISIEPDMVISYYSKAGSVEDNDIGVADMLGGVYAEAVGYEHIDEWTAYEITGDMLAALKEEEIPAMEVVLETRETELNQNIQGLNALLDVLGTN